MIPTAVNIKTKKAIIPPIIAPCITRISVTESNILTKIKKEKRPNWNLLKTTNYVTSKH